MCYMVSLNVFTCSGYASQQHDYHPHQHEHGGQYHQAQPKHYDDHHSYKPKKKKKKKIYVPIVIKKKKKKKRSLLLDFLLCILIF